MEKKTPPRLKREMSESVIVRKKDRNLNLREIEDDHHSFGSNEGRISKSLENKSMMDSWFTHSHDSESTGEHTLCIKQVDFERRKRSELEAKILKQEQLIRALYEENAELKDEIDDVVDPRFSYVVPSPPPSKRGSIVATSVEVNALQSEIARLLKQLDEQTAKAAELEKQLKQVTEVYDKKMSDNLNHEIDVEVLQRKVKALEEQNSQHQFCIEKKDEDINFLRKELEEKNEDNYKMALKLLDYKSKVSSVDIQLRRYTVKKIYKLMYWTSSDVEIILSKNPGNGSLNLDVVEKGKHLVKPFKSVQLVKDSTNRFFIYYTDGYYDMFESDSAQTIVQDLQEISN